MVFKSDLESHLNFIVPLWLHLDNMEMGPVKTRRNSYYTYVIALQPELVGNPTQYEISSGKF